MKLVRSALRTGRPYSPGNIPAAGTIMSMKNSKDTIGNRTHDRPVCNAVPQTTAPPHTPVTIIYIYFFTYIPSKLLCVSICLRSSSGSFLNQAYIKHKQFNRLKGLPIKYVDVIIFVVERQQSSTDPD
jgi:hypothetical protein